jgi:homoserine dehydrogenase
MSQKVYIGIIGLGVVGSSVAKVIKRNSSLITKRTGIQLVIKKAADVRNKKSIVGSAYTNNAFDVINDPDISIVIETMGGSEPARKFVLAAIKNGKHVVTSNKELIAKHGREIFDAAKKGCVQVLFEASVCGGIPILQALRNSLAANHIKEVYGIVNGTTNYILSKMTNEGLSFSEALKQAQNKGYAEADPTMDVDGSDAMYKSAILASVVSGSIVNIKDIYKEGISKVTIDDIDYAKEIGYVIKLLAIVKNEGNELEVRVHPTLIEKEHPLAKVSDNFNAVFVKGDAVGDLMFYGQGAGGEPTASAVMSDVIEISRSLMASSSCNDEDCCCGEGVPCSDVKIKIKKMDNVVSRYYIRMETPDEPGVLAGIAGVFAKKGVSIQEVVQRGSFGKTTEIVIILHENKEKNIQDALNTIAKLRIVKRICNVIRVGVA